MTTGLALVLVLALALFIAVALLVWSTGLLMDAAFGDFMAKVLVYAAFLLLWLLPSVCVAVGWWFHR